MAERHDRYEIDGVRSRNSEGSFPWFTLLLILLVVVMGLAMLSPFPEKVRRKLGISSPPAAPQVKEGPVKIKTVVEERVVEKVVELRPAYFTVPSNVDIFETSKGFTFRSELNEVVGGLASGEREADGSYEAAYTLTIHKPTSAKTLQEVQQVNPYLRDLLPGLPRLMEGAKVSPFFDRLYANKAKRLKANATKLDDLLTKHNYFDCQTMVNLQHPVSKRRVFLMQADMDVVSDGSDGDRLATMPDDIVNSTYYQPTTSYGWRKVGTTPNPMIAGLKRRMENGTSELNAAGTTAARKAWLNERIEKLRVTIEDLERRSYLIADYDPFIVMPVDVITDREDPFGPNVGDYGCVIYGKKIYPVIVGDGGPTFKVGEGSLRLAKEINERANPYNRPVSDVSVTYLVFPRSAPRKFGPPDYADWRSKCAQFLEEIGGLGEGYELHIWENTLPGN